MKVIRGGLHLNGHNAWLGAGDFSGGCISGRVKFSQYSECYLEDARAHSLNIFQTVSFWTERMSTDASGKSTPKDLTAGAQARNLIVEYFTVFLFIVKKHNMIVPSVLLLSLI